MDSSNKKFSNSTCSTPKRRRLGIGRITKSPRQRLPQESMKSIYKGTSTTQGFSCKVLDRETCESPPLPCNQVEYLHASTSVNVTTPAVEEYSISGIAAENWESPVVSPKITLQNTSVTKSVQSQRNNVYHEFEDISDEMFHTKLELPDTDVENNRIASEKTNFIQDININDTFDKFDQSVCVVENKDDIGQLFETKDSFLLDIRETSICIENKDVNNKINIDEIKKNNRIDNGFYGLPVMVKELFKTYRNIEKFYDWQEECLNLDSLKNRRNLIYALPTSGGKTLVAEVLMLREVLNNHRNALFILPYVAIVQEKIWGLSPFAVQLGFLVEEYAAGKGCLPPMKRRKKNSIYVATIEKGLALIRSLIELNRLNELGLIVVDELHLIGEPTRGGTLEILLTTVIFANQGIQIVGMSATIGNLAEIAAFLQADLYQGNFRPVDLHEYVKLGDRLHRLKWTSQGLEVVPDRQLTLEYSAAARALDPDGVAALVAEVDSCLVFCPTKRSCENVAAMLATLLGRQAGAEAEAEAGAGAEAGPRRALAAALAAEGAAPALRRLAARGLAFHHAGLGADERRLLEDAFRGGVLAVVCCTSTLAAGVNMPARRVLVRTPRTHSPRAPLITLAAYRQMAGRAGRAGLSATGESIIICGAGDWAALRGVLAGALGAARSGLRAAPAALRSLALSAVALGLAPSRAALRRLLGCSLLAAETSEADLDELCDSAIRELIAEGALVAKRDGDGGRAVSADCPTFDDCVLSVSMLGNAAIKGCMELETAKQLLADVAAASRGLVLLGALHLLYLVTPHAPAGLGIRPDYRNYYHLYTNLDEEGLRVAKSLGITEMNAIRMITGKPITNVSEQVLSRFYVALMLRDLWRDESVAVVADRYAVSRGAVQAAAGAAQALAARAARVCGAMPARWAARALLAELAGAAAALGRPRAAAGLADLMRLPAVRKARAAQLVRAGFGRVEQVARAEPRALAGAVPRLSRAAAQHLVSAARLILIEKVENLRAEAEDVMEELNMQ